MSAEGQDPKALPLPPGAGANGAPSPRGQEVAARDAKVGADPTPVDFEALHAALGEGSREAAPPPPVAPGSKPPARGPVAESHGRSNATYASARAQAPPAAHVDTALGAPAVIIAADASPPSPLLQSTPMPPSGPGMGMSGHPSSGPHAAAPTPSSGGMRAAPAPLLSPTTPQSFNPLALGALPTHPGGGHGQPSATMRMPDRPRRLPTPTVVVRDRGPSGKQKFAVFMVMLVLVSALGVGLVWRAPHLFGLGPRFAPPSPTHTAVAMAPAATTSPASASVVVTPTASSPVGVVGVASASAPASSASVASSAAGSPSASAGAPTPAKPALKPRRPAAPSTATDGR